MTNTSPKRQRVPTQEAEVAVTAQQVPDGEGAGLARFRSGVKRSLPLPVPLNTGAGLQNYSPLSSSNILDTTTREKLPNRILTEKERERAHGEGHLLGILRPCYCRRDRMSRGLRQKEKSRLGERGGPDGLQVGRGQ